MSSGVAQARRYVITDDSGVGGAGGPPASPISSGTMFFLLSKKLAWVALPGVWVAVLLGLAFLARRHRALAAALVLGAFVTLGALASPPTVNFLERTLAASGRSTMKPEGEYDVAIVLGSNEARNEAGAEVVRSGRARYLLYSGALGPARA